jgi:hypothetical protein
MPRGRALLHLLTLTPRFAAAAAAVTLPVLSVRKCILQGIIGPGTKPSVLRALDDKHVQLSQNRTDQVSSAPKSSPRAHSS